jgi:hypothetical protein
MSHLLLLKREKTKQMVITLWEYVECFKSNGILEIELQNGNAFRITNYNKSRMLQIECTASSTVSSNADAPANVMGSFTHIQSFINEHGDSFLDNVRNIAIKEIQCATKRAIESVLVAKNETLIKRPRRQ